MGSFTSNATLVQQTIQNEINATNTYITGICTIIASQSIIDLVNTEISNMDKTNRSTYCTALNNISMADCTNIFFSNFQLNQYLSQSCIQQITSNITKGTSTDDYYTLVQTNFINELTTNPT